MIKHSRFLDWMVPLCGMFLALAPTLIQAAGPQIVTVDSASPLVEVKVMVKAGAAADPAGQEGLAYLTARMMLEGAYGDPKNPVTKEKLAEMTRLWGEASLPTVRVDKETSTFSMTVPRAAFREYLDKVLRPLFTQPLLQPAELDRLRNETIESISSELRYEDVEGLGLTVLDAAVFRGTPYDHATRGTVQGLKRVDAEAVRRFYRTYYKPENVVVGLGTADTALTGAVEPALATMGNLPGEIAPLPARTMGVAKPLKGRSVLIIAQPNAISSGVHAGFPIPLTRADKDYWALYVANVFFGTHRDSFGRLYNDFRQDRGYNYGDYSYIEWFASKPRYLFPPTNTPRRQQYFSIWVRPVAHAHVHHLLKALTWELENFVRTGMTPEECELAKNKARVLYLSLAENTSRLVGYRLDDSFYGLKEGYLDSYLQKIAALTPAEINAAIKKYLQAKNMLYVIVTRGDVAAQLADDIAQNRNAAGKSPAEYQIDSEDKAGGKIWQVPASKLDILQMDRVWAEYWLEIPRDRIRTVPAAKMFEDASLGLP